jgi:hypothetical protein
MVSNTDRFIKKIENASTEEIKTDILHSLTENNENLLMDYLKTSSMFVLYIYLMPYEKAKLLLAKVIDCFNVQNVNIDETLDIIRPKMTRCSDWKESGEKIANDSPKKKNLSQRPPA